MNRKSFLTKAFSRASLRGRGLAAKLLALLLIASMLMGGTAAYADSAIASDDTTRIIFYNTRSDKTGLYVTKTVQNKYADYPSPSATEFSFFLTIDDEPASDMPYYLRDANGKRLYLYDGVFTTVEKPGVAEDDLRTDRDGKFKVRAEWTACFEDLTPGMAYKVEEGELPFYECIEPVTGVAEGILKEEGASVRFVNRYAPIIPIIPDPTKPATLTVEKKVLFPDQYEQPDTPEFSFTIMVGNTLLANAPYEIYEVDGRTSVGSGETDENGVLKLQGGYKAVFKDLKAGQDYSVTENDTPGWRCVTKNRLDGSLAENTTASFTNVTASFAVSKDIDDGSVPEQSFRFLLTDGEGNAMADVPYLLYNSNKKLVQQEPLTTGEDGSFSLMAQQTAVFLGLDKGTAFSVREIQDERYQQTVPASANGYSRTVTDSVIVYPFVNQELKTETALTIRKVVTNRTDMDIKDQVYTFLLEKKGASGFEPVQDAIYYVGDASYRVSDGKLTLKGGETARFEDLEQGEYRATEITDELPEGFSIEASERVQTGTLEEVLSFTFSNVFAQNVVTKTETKPGEATALSVGDEITYEISGINYKDRAAEVTIGDTLPVGTELVATGTTAGYETETDSDGRTVVTWKFQDVPEGETCKVTLVLRLTEDALVADGDGLMKVDNQGKLRVGNDSWYLSNIVSNPIVQPPVKEELAPGANTNVYPDATVSYKITGKNYRREAASMVLTDELDENVELVEEGTTPGYTLKTEGGKTLAVWSFETVQPGEERTVQIMVRVKKEAVAAGKITNKGSMTVADDPSLPTEDVENPVKALTPAYDDPPVKKVVEGDTPSEASNFVFRLTAVSTTAEGLNGVLPMPSAANGAQTMTVTIRGAGEREFGVITFEEPGTYIYKVNEEPGSDSNYEYDPTVYTIEYEVVQNGSALECTRTFKKDGEAVEEAAYVFTNKYTKPMPSPSPTPAPGGKVKTGDEATPLLWIGLLAGSAIVLGAVVFILIKRKKK